MDAGREAWGQTRLQEHVLDRLRQGLCVYDGQRRLLLWNRRYAEMYKLGAGALRAGMTLPEVVALRVAAGTGPDMAADEYNAWRNRIQVQPWATVTTVTLQNVAVHEIHHEPTPDGGWVATFDDITERRRAAARIQHMAHHDALTDLPNRALFDERLRDVAPGGAGTVAVLCLDLDRFKAVNDTWGHAAGDALLQAAAGRMRAELRHADTLARLGGDEFGVILRVADAEEAAACARRLVGALSRPFQVHGQGAGIGVSIGIALADGGGPEHLLRCADVAMYRAKAEQSGFQFFQPGADAVPPRRRILERDLAGAAARGELLLQYQPQYDLRTGGCCGREALLRWRRDGAVVPAGEFIAMAEDAGLIGGIGAWVLREACMAGASERWPGPALRMAVNLSPVQVRGPGLVAMVEGVLRDTGFPPGLLEMEITEGTLLHDTAHTLEVLQGLRALGVGLALDDFGKGYSSLGYLRRFPFTRLKIDRAFVDGADAGGAAIVRAVAALGRELGLRVVAEGIETEEQLRRMQALGCDEGQGYFLGEAA